MTKVMGGIRWLTLSEAAKITKYFPSLSSENKNATYDEAKRHIVSDKSSGILAACEAQCLTPMGQFVTCPIPSDAAHPKESS
jgi:hypothetical protein